MTEEFKVPVSGGHFALVDESDFKNCSALCWTLNHGGYASNYHFGSMHTFVFGKAPKGLVTDHINRNKLDNRKSNLRHVTYGQNFVNRPSIFTEDMRNIYHTIKGSFAVRITRNKKSISLGAYKTKQEAAKVRDDYILANFPETVL